MDKIITRVLGNSALISRVAWMPLSLGIAMSMTTMSGRSSFDKRTASCPSCASPMHSNSSFCSSSERRPSKKILWSSAIRTVRTERLDVDDFATAFGVNGLAPSLSAALRKANHRARLVQLRTGEFHYGSPDFRSPFPLDDGRDDQSVVSPSRTAYFVRSEMLRRPSLSRMCLR